MRRVWWVQLLGVWNTNDGDSFGLVRYVLWKIGKEEKVKKEVGNGNGGVVKIAIRRKRGRSW